DGADDDLVLQQDADHQEDDIEQEHDEAQQFAHLPLTGGNGDDDEEEHEEEQHDGAEQTVTTHPNRAHIVDNGEQQPWER
ncbi:hypothetical protein M9458_014715, partial [Cirrhinus mrigala]